MSSNKISEPKKAPVSIGPNAPPLGLAPEELVAEWQKLSDIFSSLQERLVATQETIAVAQNDIQEINMQKQAIISQLEILARIFIGLGIDPNCYEPKEEKNSPSPTVFTNERILK